MSTNTVSVPCGEVLRSMINAADAAAASGSRPRPFGFGRNAAPTAVREPAVLRRHPHLVRFADVGADLDLLIDRAITAIADGEPIETRSSPLRHIASLVRAVSFREGKLLEQAVERLAKANPNILVLTQSLKLPLVKAAMEAVAGNDWSSLDGIKLDCEAPAKGSYTPDLIVVNRARHTAYILDLKRSLASYGDTSRLEELKLKMMASAMVLPDWLYKNQKRLMVDAVEVAIVDGASRPSDHANGVWALFRDRRPAGDRWCGRLHGRAAPALRHPGAAASRSRSAQGTWFGHGACHGSGSDDNGRDCGAPSADQPQWTERTYEEDLAARSCDDDDLRDRLDDDGFRDADETEDDEPVPCLFGLALPGALGTDLARHPTAVDACCLMA